MRPRLHRPTTLKEALSLLGEMEEAMVYGGGTAIQILAKQGLLFVEELVDVSGIPELHSIQETSDGIRLGATATVRQAERNPQVRSRARLAAEAYGKVANPRIRNTATIGGNIAHGDYRLDPPTALMALDATVEVASMTGTRTVAAREFFVAFQQTALKPGEMVTAITLPTAPERSGWGYSKMSSLAMNDWPVASIAALLAAEGPRSTLRLGIGALAPTPCHTEVDVSGLDHDSAVRAGTAAVEELLDPIPDIRGTADYKRRLGVTAARDAIHQAWRNRDEQ